MNDVRGLKVIRYFSLPFLLIVAASGVIAARGYYGTWIDTEVVVQVASAILYFSLAMFGARVINVLLQRKSKKRRPPKLLSELISGALFLIATIATAGVFLGGSVSGLLAGSGLVIAVLGFALRNIVADVLSGVAFGLEAPFRIGDWVDIEGTTKGQIVEIGWRSTRLLTRDSIYMILPNSQIAKQRLTNFSAPRRHYRAQVNVVLDHSVEVVRARKVLLEGAKAAALILPDPEPDVRATSFSLDGVVYAIRYWVPTFAADIDCRDQVLEAIDTALREAGLNSARRHATFDPIDITKPPMPAAGAHH
jgi:small-conductance mechanosensitive channel